MNTRAVRWLYKELPALVDGGVLDEESAGRLRRHYGPLQEGSATRRLLMVFGALGALLIGSGIVLLLAHNWDELARPTRAGISFALLLAGQAVAGWALWRHGNSPAWTESAGIFLPLSLVASIALIDQTYQIASAPEWILLASVVLTIPAMYLLRSRGAAALVWIGIPCWLFATPWFPSLPFSRLVGLVALVGATAPFLAWLLRKHIHEPRTALVGWVASACLALCLVPLAESAGHRLWIPLYAGLLAGLYSLGAGSAVAVTGWRNPLHAFGALGTGILLIALSFRDSWRETVAVPRGAEWTLYGAGAVSLLIAALAGLWAFRFLRGGRLHQALLAAVPLITAACWLSGHGERGVLVSMVLINVYAFVTGLAICVDGLRRGQLGHANAGLLLMVGIGIMRFVDADLSFVVRGVSFIVLGAGFLAMNVWMLRRREEGRS
jgi:uncharacterized membrane protein